MTLFISSISLKDVEGMWGGQNIYSRKFGETIVQIIDRTQHETRYNFNLPTEKMMELEALLEKNNFMQLEIPMRYGVPGEVLQTITVTLFSGEVKLVNKWANDKKTEFDAIYKWLLNLTVLAKEHPPSFQGRYDHAWQPSGF
ncbi:MAG: hypothetical protein HY819_17115 [Acidobacteria bacterium]|nr:hypothetical protein [Acidobacteriota bacterium]